MINKIEPVNTGRQFEIDCARFFAIIFMVFVHTYEEIGKFDWYTAPSSPFRNTAEFIGGPLAAPVFMLAMGIGMVYTRHKSADDFLRRSWKLLLMGYVLNFFRYTVYLLLGGLMDYQASVSEILDSLLMVDILQFAGMAFLAIGLMKKIRMSAPQMLVAALLFEAAGLWGNRLHISNTILQDILGLFIPVGEENAFPMTLWLIYPVFGVLFAEVLQRTENKKVFYRNVITGSLIFFAALTSSLIWSGYDVRRFYELADNSYYYQSLLHVLWIVPVILTALSLDYFILRGTEKSRFGTLVKYFSRNVNMIYVIQWLLIPYALAAGYILTDFDGLSAWQIVLFGVVIIVLSALVSFLWLHIKRRFARTHEEKEK